MATTEAPAPVAIPEDTALAEKTAALAVQDETTAESSRSPSVNDAPEPTEGAPAHAKATEPSHEDLAPTKPISTPIPKPLPASKPQPAHELTPEQQAKYEELLAHVKGWSEIPTKAAPGSSTEPVNDHDRLWLTRECLLRYLRATKWVVSHASQRILGTLIWHREFGLRSHLTASHVSPENETGKQLIMGFDIHGRPCLFLDPGKQNTDFKVHGHRQTESLVWMLQKVVDLLPPGQETVALLINYKDTTSAKNPPMKQSREVLHILQTHYPERLGRALINDLPWYVTTFYKLISPFLDPVTRSKMVFNESLPKHVPAEQLLANHGGNVQFKYEHDKYWPALNDLCDARRRDFTARWERAGKQIGEHEAFLRGGDATSLDGKLNGKQFPDGFAANAAI